MSTDLALLRLLQLVSANLPVGMYSYSQGLEKAVEEGWVSNADETGEWISGVFQQGLLYVDLPILLRLYQAWLRQDEEGVCDWSATLLANRETVELRNEDRQIGQALARLLADLDLPQAEYWRQHRHATLATLFALAVVNWQIPQRSMLTGYAWSWLENQVISAIKLVPLGQRAGQLLLHDLSSTIERSLDDAMQLADHQIGGSVFALTLASSRHEMQYSRLFRS